MIGTSNKTEALLGYTTIWGDNASALNLIADLYKTQVRELARAIGVPQVIVDKAPSADLEPNQTDESDLGYSYYAMDSVLVRFVDHLMLPDEIKMQLLLEEGDIGIDWAGCVDKLCGISTPQVMKPGLVDIMEYKRRLTPIVPKISRATIETDYRPAQTVGAVRFFKENSAIKNKPPERREKDCQNDREKPPCPGITSPESLTFTQRLRADSSKSPNCPNMPIATPISSKPHIGTTLRKEIIPGMVGT